MTPVLLRAIQAADVERLEQMRRAPEVARWWGPPEPGWWRAEDPQDTAFAVEVDGELAGYVQYWEEPDPGSRHADVDVFVGPDYQDRGVGSEALRALLDHLLDERGHHRVTLSTSPENARAIHVYEKLGFRCVGTMRLSARLRPDGDWEDELLMELVRPPRPRA